MKQLQNKTLMKPFPNKTPHEAIPYHNPLEAVRPLCYRVIVLRRYRLFMEEFQNKTLMKQSGYRVVVLLPFLYY